MRNLPNIYSQRNPQWASQRLGTVDGTTIGGYGCYITSFSMLACYYGHLVTPPQLDDTFTNNHWYYNASGTHTDPANELADTDLDLAFPDIPFQEVDNYLTTAADLGKLKNLLTDPSISVVLELDFDHDPSDGIQTHFVVAVDCDGTNVTIADPWYGSVDPMTKNYGSNPSQTILKFVVYKGNPMAHGTYVDAVTFARLVDKSTKYDAFTAAGYSTINDVTTKINSLQATVDSLNGITKDKDQQIASLQAQASSLDSQVTSLTQAKETAEGIAKQVPTLQAELTQAQGDRSTCLAAQEGQNKKIATLQQMVDAKKPINFIDKLIYLFT